MDYLTFFPTFLYNQLFVSIPYPKESFDGQTVIVTCANIGLGLEAARHITALKAAKVILACRNTEKAEAAKASIEESTGVKGVVEVWQLDLASHDSVKAFAERAKGLPRLDVLLQNAGVAQTKWILADGDEQTITVNFISPFLLSALLLPKLRETAAKYNVQPRLAIVTSEAHIVVRLPERNNPSGSVLAAMRDEKTPYITHLRYGASKVLEVFAVRELADLIKKDSVKGEPAVIVNCINPGMCRSNLLPSEFPGFVREIVYFLTSARSTEVGSRTLVHAAGAGPETHGEYLSNSQVTPPSWYVRSEAGEQMQKRVWKELLQRLEEIEPGVTSNFPSA
jgi:retinol dehydrogenase 12